MRRCCCPTCGSEMAEEDLAEPDWSLAALFRCDPLLASKIEAESEQGCWLWTAAKQKSGSKENAVYGNVWRRRRKWFSHRWVYHLLVGRIPDNYHVHHTCMNTLCCNPRHLETVEAGEHEWLHREIAAMEAA